MHGLSDKTDMPWLVLVQVRLRIEVLRTPSSSRVQVLSNRFLGDT